jgi:hypothetical protein
MVVCVSTTRGRTNAETANFGFTDLLVAVAGGVLKRPSLHIDDSTSCKISAGIIKREVP